MKAAAGRPQPAHCSRETSRKAYSRQCPATASPCDSEATCSLGWPWLGARARPFLPNTSLPSGCFCTRVLCQPRQDFLGAVAQGEALPTWSLVFSLCVQERQPCPAPGEPTRPARAPSPVHPMQMSSSKPLTRLIALDTASWRILNHTRTREDWKL